MTIVTYCVQNLLCVRQDTPREAEKTAQFYFRHISKRPFSSPKISDTHILQYIRHHMHISYSLYDGKQGTSLSFNGTARQRTVRALPSSCFDELRWQIDSWSSVQQTIIGQSIDQWRRHEIGPEAGSLNIWYTVLLCTALLIYTFSYFVTIFHLSDILFMTRIAAFHNAS